MFVNARAVIVVSCLAGLLPSSLLAQAPADKLRLTDLTARCATGDAAGCAELAYAYEGGYYGAARDARRAAELNQRACNGGVGTACVSLAVAYQRGRGVRQNPVTPTALFSKGCDLAAPYGCENLALRLARGEGVARDQRRALTVWQRGCNLGSGPVCRSLATSLEAGDSIARDERRALVVHIQACLLREYSSCLDAARSLSTLTDSDISEVVALYDLACRQGFETYEACVELGDMFRDGGRVARNSERSLALYEEGCNAGFVSACRAMRAAKNEPWPGVDEQLPAPDYLTSVPVTIHPALGSMRLRLYGDAYGRLDRIDVFDERANRVTQQIRWPDQDSDPPQRFPGGIPPVETSDLNFDGYQDLMAMGWAGATGNKGFVVWDLRACEASIRAQPCLERLVEPRS